MRATTLIAMCLVTTLGLAKDKPKKTLPTFVLRAQTVAVIIDPHAGISMDDPEANRVAQRDVEAALLNWGRYNPILQVQDADLVIVVRRGSGRLVNNTIGDPRQNNRPGSITPMDDGVSGSAQQGSGPHRPEIGSDNRGLSPQTEIGQSDDSFVVYEGGGDHPFDRAPAWRYIAKDGLLPHAVPAVDAFHKAVTDAEKAAAKTP